jgi:hypothetical protein
MSSISPSSTRKPPLGLGGVHGVTYCMLSVPFDVVSSQGQTAQIDGGQRIVELQQPTSDEAHCSNATPTARGNEHEHVPLALAVWFIRPTYHLLDWLVQEERRNEGGGWFSSGTKQELAQRKRELSVLQQELSVKIAENGTFDSCSNIAVVVVVAVSGVGVGIGIGAIADCYDCC